MQEMPRAPTPVPDVPKAGRQIKAKGSSLRRQSTLSQPLAPATQQPDTDTATAMSPSREDARSPLESMAQTPVYSEDSPVDIGSSPPVARTAPFIPSSPAPSSPILPPMPRMPQADSGFMSGGIDDLFEDEDTRMMLEEIHPKVLTRNIANVGQQVFKLHKPTSGNVPQGPIPRPTSQPAVAPETVAPTSPLKQVVSMRKESIPLPSTEAEDQSQPTGLQPAVTLVTALNTNLQLPQPAAAVPEMKDPFSRPELPDASKSFPAPRTTSRAGSRPAQRTLSRSASLGPLALPTIPASDPVGPQAPNPSRLSKATSFSEAPCPPSEAVCPPSEAPCPPSEAPGPASEAPGQDNEAPPPCSPRTDRENKNYVKKQSIKQRLEKAIASGEVPPFCRNCGAIETPTWRKMWSRDLAGPPPQGLDFSDKAGQVTALTVLEPEGDQPAAYRLTKKTLGPEDDKSEWSELLLCNRKHTILDSPNPQAGANSVYSMWYLARQAPLPSSI